MGVEQRAIVLVASLVAVLSVGILLNFFAGERRLSLVALTSLTQGHRVGETAEARSVRDRVLKVEAMADSLAARVGVSAGREGLKPLIWLHVPKAGSYFETTIVHWACGRKVARAFSLVEPASVPKERVPSCLFNGESFPAETPSKCSTEFWNTACGARSFARFTSAHHPLWRPPSSSMPLRTPYPAGFGYGQAFGNVANITDAHLSQVVALFREPRQRAISGWFHDKHDCTAAMTFGQYAQCVSACQAQMLLGVWCGTKGEFGLGSEPELLGFSPQKAADVYRARMGQLGFVGLTEHWELTICLFHAMYGGECLPVEFRSGRKGKFRTSDSYSIKDYNLLDYMPLDDDVYRVASEVFWRKAQIFGVSAETCARSICPLAASQYRDI